MPNPSELLYGIQQFLKCYEKQMNHTAAHYQLTTTELNILLFLANRPDMDTARDIVELRGLPKSCVSRAVDSLSGRVFWKAVRIKMTGASCIFPSSPLLTASQKISSSHNRIFLL